MPGREPEGALLAVNLGDDADTTGAVYGQLAGHLVCVAGGRLDSIALCMSNKSRNAVQLPLRLVRQDGYWDYRAEGAAEVATGTVQVPAGQDRWVTWPLGLNGLTDGGYRIEARPAPGLAWRVSSGLVPGHVGVYAISPTRRRFRHNTFAFKVAPPQSIFAAANVLTGVTRPGNGTNLCSTCVRKLPTPARPRLASA